LGKISNKRRARGGNFAVQKVDSLRKPKTKLLGEIKCFSQLAVTLHNCWMKAQICCVKTSNHRAFREKIVVCSKRGFGLKSRRKVGRKTKINTENNILEI